MNNYLNANVLKVLITNPRNFGENVLMAIPKLGECCQKAAWVFVGSKAMNVISIDGPDVPT